MENNGAWQLPDEVQMLQETVRRFMRTEVLPLEEKLEHDATSLLPDDLVRLRKQAQELGLWMLRTPAEYGGAGLSLLAQAVAAEEASQCRMGAYVPGCNAFGKDPPIVIFKGSDELKERYGLPSVAGEKKGFVAISEASGGSDPARSIRCRAVRKGDKYIVNGTKMWITDAQSSDWGVVYVRTGDQGDRGGITCLVVENPSPGLSFKKIEVIRSYPPFEVTFENVEVPVANRIGEEGEGFRIADGWLTGQRVPYAATSIGLAQAALNLAIPWVLEREVFGSKLADKQAIQWMLADSEIEIRAARLLVYQAAWKGDLGQDFKTEAAIAKLVATETASRVIDRVIQMFGGLGIAAEMPLERWYRESRIRRIGEGPSEVQRMLVARHLLKGGRR